MADIPESNVFKFVAVRPPTPPEQRREQLGFVKDARPAAETPVGRLIAQVDRAAAVNLADVIKRFVAEQQYDLAFPQSAGDTKLAAIDSAVRALEPDQISTAH